MGVLDVGGINDAELTWADSLSANQRLNVDPSSPDLGQCGTLASARCLSWWRARSLSYRWSVRSPQTQPRSGCRTLCEPWPAGRGDRIPPPVDRHPARLESSQECPAGSRSRQWSRLRPVGRDINSGRSELRPAHERDFVIELVPGRRDGRTVQPALHPGRPSPYRMSATWTNAAAESTCQAPCSCIGQSGSHTGDPVRPAR